MLEIVVEVVVIIIMLLLLFMAVNGVNVGGGGGGGRVGEKKVWLDIGSCVELSSKKGDLAENGLQLIAGSVDLALELKDEAVATAGGVFGANIGLVDYRVHGVLAVALVDGFEYFEDVGDAEEAMDVEELLLFVSGEVGGEGAIGGAFAALVLASGAGGGRGGGGRGRRGSVGNGGAGAGGYLAHV